MDLNDDGHPVDALARALDAEVGELGAIRTQDPTGNGLEVVDRTEVELRVGAPLRDFDDVGVEAHPEREEGVIILAVDVEEPDACRGDDLHVCSTQRLCRLHHILRHVMNSGEDIRRAGGNDAECRRRTHEAVRNVVDDSVAAHRNHDIDPVGCRLRGATARAGCVVRPLGAHLERLLEGGHHATEAGTGEAGRRRVRNEDEAPHGSRRLTRSTRR